MDPAALARRRKRRRVTDDRRKRAARACNSCKTRKSKCIQETPDQCQRCVKNDLSCHFERELSPEDGPDEYQESPSTNRQSSITPRHAAEDNISINSHQADRIAWPRFLSRLRQAFSLEVQATPEAQDMVAMQAHISGTSPLQPAQLPQLSRAIDSFPPRHVADFLISVCIRHGVDCFFYFDQAQLLVEIEEFYTNSQSPLRVDYSFVALALAIFALGSQWTPLERPEGWSSIAATPDSESSDPVMIFHNRLRDLVPDLIERSCLRSIQVLFIMAVYLMPLSPIGSSYVYMGLALRKALAFDIHQNTEDAVLDAREVEIRRRLWWSIYSLERITAIKLNRSNAIHKDIITTPLPSPNPAIDSSQVFDNIQQQIAIAKLVKILDSVADIGDDIAEKTKANARSRIEADLKEWKRSLPAEFKLAKIDSKSSSYRSVFHLYLNYYYAHISMGKASVVTVVRSHLRYHLTKDPKPQQVDPAIKDVAVSCINAAEKILRLFEDLMNTGNIVRLSFTDFQGCSIATIVTLLAGILERDSGYEARVAFGLGCLRKMAAGNMTAKLGVRFVEALQTISDEAVVKLRRNETLRASPGTQEDQEAATTAADYAMWAQWLTVHESRSRPLSSSTAPSGALPQAQIDNHLMQERTPMTNASPAWDPTLNGQPFNPSAPEGTTFQHTRGIFPEYTQTADASLPLPSMLFGEDQNFLMGLTGLDVLDFTELSTPF